MSKDLIIRSSSAEFLIFERQTHDKGIQVRFEDGDLWLTQKSIGELFDTTRNNITSVSAGFLHFFPLIVSLHKHHKH